MNNLITCLVVLLIGTQLSLGQHKSGSITGKLLDLETKEGLAQASISLQTDNDKYIQFQTSDENGGFHFQNVSPGRYKLWVTLIGYASKTVGPFVVCADSSLSFTLELDPYVGWTAEDAKKDLANNVVRIYEGTWFLIMGQYELAKKYGFEIVQNGCNPMFRADRYNAVVYSYLDRLNGPGWLDKYTQQLDSLRIQQEIYLKTHK
jgi:hypothetical protein